MPETPEQRARRTIDATLAASGWTAQTRDQTNLAAYRGVAIGELAFKSLTVAEVCARRLRFPPSCPFSKENVSPHCLRVEERQPSSSSPP